MFTRSGPASPPRNNRTPSRRRKSGYSASAHCLCLRAFGPYLCARALARTHDAGYPSLCGRSCNSFHDLFRWETFPEQPRNVVVLASFGAEMYGEPLHCAVLIPCRSDGDFTPGGANAESLRGKPQDPHFTRLFYVPTAIANVLQHRSDPSTETRQVCFRVARFEQREHRAPELNCQSTSNQCWTSHLFTANLCTL